MNVRSAIPFVLWLGLTGAGVVAAGCGSSSSMPVTQVTVTSSTAIVSGGRFVASGSKGVTFTFAVGAGVPAGESAVVSALPATRPCTVPACTAVQTPLDGFQITVGPQPLPVSMLPSVALTGVPSPFEVSVVLQDMLDTGAFSNFFLLPPTGGSLSITDPASARPVFTLAPNHTYAFAIYATSIPPP